MKTPSPQQVKMCWTIWFHLKFSFFIWASSRIYFCHAKCVRINASSLWMHAWGIIYSTYIIASKSMRYTNAIREMCVCVSRKCWKRKPRESATKLFYKSMRHSSTLSGPSFTIFDVMAWWQWQLLRIPDEVYKHYTYTTVNTSVFFMETHTICFVRARMRDMHANTIRFHLPFLFLCHFENSNAKVIMNNWR